MYYFELLCDWLEMTCDQLYSILELHEIMQRMAGQSAEVYSVKRFQQLLVERYEGHIYPCR